MVTSAMEIASALDQPTLDALQENVVSVLAKQCGSTELHAFIDGKNALDKMLWAHAGQLGWLGLGIPEQFGGLGMGAQGLAILHGELGRQAAPGPYILPACRRRRPSSKPAANRFARHGCRGWHPARSAPRCRQHWTCAA